MIDDDAIARALETSPVVPVPEDFTVRLMARVPVERPLRVSAGRAMLARPSVGRRFVYATIVTVALAMVVLAPLTAHSTLWVLVQMALFAECGALLLWFSYRSAE